MTGKELKQWAALVHDDAEVEVNADINYRSGWYPLEVRKVRAVHTVCPPVTMDHACNLEETPA